MMVPSALQASAAASRPALLAVTALLCLWQADGGGLALAVTGFLVVLATPLLTTNTPRFTAALAWGLYAGAVAAVLALTAGAMTWRILPFTLLVAGQSLALMGLAGPGQALRRRFMVGLTALVITASPVWLAPGLEAAGQAVHFDWLVAANPLLHLGAALGADPLRSDWLYRHSPVGSYAYRYPGMGPVLAATWAVAVLSWAAAEYGRRQPTSVSSTPDPGDDP